MPQKAVFSALLTLVLLLLCSCAAPRQDNILPSLYALEGPPLAVYGKLGDLVLEGSMDRGCMVGIGVFSLHARLNGEDLSCTAEMDSPPNEKARVKGVLECSGQAPIFFTMRNLGPDQGLGVGRAQDNTEELLFFFYHPSMEEAERRLPEIISDIHTARKNAAKKSGG